MNNSINFSHLTDLIFFEHSNMKITHHTQDISRENNQSIDENINDASLISSESEKEV